MEGVGGYVDIRKAKIFEARQLSSGLVVYSESTVIISVPRRKSGLFLMGATVLSTFPSILRHVQLLSYSTARLSSKLPTSIHPYT